ncbi:succinylglutamate desuccinylase/aspartoacylase domain-containing protein [Silvanigrella aquatica]|uniref:Succinylglutamate desuccinylase/Aspartoacylase catalytic domain-containing protein n=1 Tax=Silvanigrella aquatica TaxID=1915309 RepID=A0A1L4D073_9BACT|nr:succinylglutamate desuccinylase/aspartoacylase family protein [Silvanigrella aquatica]APJ03599.1 hypothetical protein AXG55_06635 [Silvanigrella aquatica]
MIKKYLSDFEILEKQYPGCIPDSLNFNFSKHKGHIVFSGIIHGNETGSLPALLEIAKLLANKKINYGGKVTLLLGNKKACLKNIRFLEYDLNRSFGNKGPHENTLEGKRATEIKKLLLDADVFVDFHQTTKPSLEPFYIFSMHEKSYLWARAIGNSNIFVTRKIKKPYSPEGMCSDEFMRFLSKAGITLELGEQGIHKNAEIICLNAMKKALFIMDDIFLKRKELSKCARKNKDFTFLEIKHSEIFSTPDKSLIEDYQNLQKIKKNTPLGKNHNGKFFYAPFDGYILFPQYPKRNEKGFVLETLPTYIYTLAREIQKL